MYSQGEIVLVPFPFTNNSGSTKRPALVISSNDFNRSSYDIILVQVTKQQNADGNSIPLKNTDLNTPLDFVSEIRCHKILVAEQTIIIKRVSSVRRHVVKKVIEKINTIIK